MFNFALVLPGYTGHEWFEAFAVINRQYEHVVQVWCGHVAWNASRTSGHYVTALSTTSDNASHNPAVEPQTWPRADV
jgi:hypothetical protein